MVGFSVEYICTAVLKAFPIDDLEVEFIEEFWPLYLSLIEIFRGSEIYEVFIIYVYLHLIFSSIEVKLSFFKWFNNNH